MASETSLDLDLSEFSSQEELLSKHRKEKKDLQSQIQKLKHSVPKGDKKKKKEITEEISKLEGDLEAKHAAELTQFTSAQQGGNAVEDEVPDEKDEKDAVIDVGDQPEGKKSKAQKRRDKKQVKDKERESRIREQAVTNRLGPRHVEMASLKAFLRTRNLSLHEIPADGNCMYNAISHQLASRNLEHSHEELRKKTADYLRSHRDDFLPFLTHPDTGDVLTEEEYEKYCDKTASAPMWGGQIELRAVSEVLSVPIEVLQADSQPMLIGDPGKGEPITLVYHRHIYRLGEHYNSVAPFTGEEEEQEGSDDDNAK